MEIWFQNFPKHPGVVRRPSSWTPFPPRKSGRKDEFRGAIPCRAAKRGEDGRCTRLQMGTFRFATMAPSSGISPMSGSFSATKIILSFFGLWSGGFGYRCKRGVDNEWERKRPRLASIFIHLPLSTDWHGVVKRGQQMRIQDVCPRNKLLGTPQRDGTAVKMLVLLWVTCNKKVGIDPKRASELSSESDV